jgi:hypothetical protein
VKAILNQPQEQPGTPKPSASQPTQAKTSAATFPPQGN